VGFLLSKLLPSLLYPLGASLLLQCLALAARRRRWSTPVATAGLLLLLLPSLPLVSRPLVRSLEDRAVSLTPAPLPRADVVLVLGGGLRPAGPPRLGVEVNESGDRLLGGVRLLRQRRAALLVVSGGRVSFTAADPRPPEAVNARRLAEELGVPATAILSLDTPRTTAEEATQFAAMARRHRWRSVLLVTSALHLPRATATFRQTLSPQTPTVQVWPVATDFLLEPPATSGGVTVGSLLLDLIPDAGSLALSTSVLREWIGLVVYRWRGQA
jgi:uncharacterized SAM-binding protein YcdF (DUF218 family)